MQGSVVRATLQLARTYDAPVERVFKALKALLADARQSAPRVRGVAERSGWNVVRIYEDAGISGAKGRDKRPGLDSMMKAVNAKRFDMVAAWSVDRLGRSLTDLLGILQCLQ